MLQKWWIPQSQAQTINDKIIQTFANGVLVSHNFQIEEQKKKSHIHARKRP